MSQLQGYRKERPLVLGQHTPISLARDGGFWKKMPFLKDNGGMLPPSLMVVGDRRRVFTASLPLKEYIMLQKEVALAGWDEEEHARLRLTAITGQLKVIASRAKQLGLYFEEFDRGYLALSPRLRSEGARIPLEPGASVWAETNWYRKMDQLLYELEWVLGNISRREFLAPSSMAATMLMMSDYPSSNPAYQEISRRLRYLADSVCADAGRVNLAIGVFEYNGKLLPVTILETQMGFPAQDINAWEVLVNSREDGYVLGGKTVPAGGINAIRAGTCGGIIIPDGNGGQLEEPFIEIGDVVNASYSFADGATVRQRMGAWSSFSTEDMERFKKAWRANNLPFTTDGVWPVLHSSPAIVSALTSSCRELGLACHEGGNLGKESLYLESDEERTKGLRSQYGALSTEMEHFGLAFLTGELTRAGIPARNGLISTVVGTVPGGSFAEPGSKEEEKANNTQGLMLEAALRSLWQLAYGK